MNYRLHTRTDSWFQDAGRRSSSAGIEEKRHGGAEDTGGWGGDGVGEWVGGGGGSGSRRENTVPRSAVR